MVETEFSSPFAHRGSVRIQPTSYYFWPPFYCIPQKCLQCFITVVHNDIQNLPLLWRENLAQDHDPFELTAKLH